MIILGIETSCDETAAAVLEQKNGRIQILSNVIASSASLQSKYGGIIPEQAAREQIKSIIPVIEEALIQSNLYPPSSKYHLPPSTINRPAIDAIAVTYGPGLIGSLLVGVETAKTLSLVWNKPLIPVNHLIGHFYANWIAITPPTFPCLGLLVSGGHTDLVLFTDHGKYKYLGGTRDDAAGECFDKCARLLGLPYPGGPHISKLAQNGNPKAYDLPRPMIDTDDFDFSFSGLKTAVANLIKNHSVIPSAARNLKIKSRDPSLIIQDDNTLADLAASIEAAIVDVLVKKTIRAAQKYNIEQIMVAGGVAANQKLTSELKKSIPDNPSSSSSLSDLGVEDLSGSTELTVEVLRAEGRPPITSLHIPPPYLCTDNGVMIASAAFFSPRSLREAGQKPIKNPLNLQANPNLSL